MQKIIPHFWFDKEAGEAADFYTTVFPDSRIISKQEIKDTPSGDSEVVSFEVMGFRFMAISAGPLFKINPSISIIVNFDPSKDENARTKIDEVWGKLIEGGRALMPLDKYPFSEWYGWVQDKYGVTWQLIYTNPEGEERPPIIPSLLFITDEGEIAEEATDFYISIFENSKRGKIVRYPSGAEPNKEGAVMFTDFTLSDQWFTAMDGSSNMHKFKFNEAISFMVQCKDQEEIDYYWKELSAVPESEQCGWLKDKFGMSWQIIPENMGELLTKNPAKVTPVMLKQKKIVIDELKQAAEE